jgi:hypothetical protein
MRAFRYVAAAALALSLLPAPVVAGQSEAQQIRALQKEMHTLQQQNARDRARISALERHAHRRAAIFTAPTAPPHVQAFAATAPAAPAPAPASAAMVQAPTYGATAPPPTAVKAVYQEQNAMFNRGWTVTSGGTYTYGDNRFFTLNGFMALGAIFLGNINVSRQESSVYEPNLNLAYAPSRRLEYDVTVPFIYRSSTFSSLGAQTSSAQTSAVSSQSGAIGDVNAGFYYQLPRRTLGGPATVLNMHVTAPTGISPYGIKVYQSTGNDNLSFVNELPTGQGAWGMQVGATMIQTIDPAVIFGGINVGYNFPAHYRDISTVPDVVQPGTIQPGGSVTLTLGTAFSLNDRMSTSFSFQDGIVGSLRERYDGQPWSSIIGSNLNEAVFNIGTSYAVTKDVSYQLVLGIGLTQDAPNFQVSFRVPHFIP